MPSEQVRPTFREALRFWLKLGFISFGGPSGQIAVMHTELVERKRWIDEGRFLHALNFCMLLPGPEAMQLATYSGWLLHRTAGGIAAGALFVLPAAVILWLLSFAYLELGTVPAIASAFYGLQIAVLAIVVQSVIRIGRKILKNPAMWFLAIGAFIGLFALRVPYPLLVIASALIGFIGGTIRAQWFAVLPDPAVNPQGDAIYHFDTPAPSITRGIRVLLVGVIVWFAPLLGLASSLGRDHALFQMGLFFSKAACLTFGGAYAILPYVAQQAVERFQWLTASQMMIGLGLAESTPGPLIMVLQFIGFLGGWQHPGDLHPLAAATLGAAITTWCTFVPSFLWIFLGGPFVERLRDSPRLTAALSAITATVVGVMVNLAAWFGWNIIRPAPGSVDFFAIGLAAIAFFLLQWRRWNILLVIVVCAASGLIWRLAA